MRLRQGRGQQPLLAARPVVGLVLRELNVARTLLPMELSLHVRPPWLAEIASGRKRVEGRAGPKSKHAAWVGKTVRLYNDHQSLLARVVAVRNYPTLGEYLEAEGWRRVAPHLGSLAEAEEAYRSLPGYESDEAVQLRGGINAIELAL